VLSSLRHLLQLAAAVSATLACFLFIPATSLLHGALPQDPELRQTRVAGKARCRVPRFTDESLEQALVVGVAGRREGAVRDQLRLWRHQQDPLLDPADPIVDIRPWAAVDKAMDSRWPVSPRWPITSTFGDRVHSVLAGRRFHSGVDIGVPQGTVIHASLRGTVDGAREDRINGRYVVLDHGDTLASVYCHASVLLVEDGQQVERGEAVALSGSTGRSTGPHLHYGLRIGRTWLDPVLVYRLQAAVRREEPGADP